MKLVDLMEFLQVLNPSASFSTNKALMAFEICRCSRNENSGWMIIIWFRRNVLNRTDIAIMTSLHSIEEMRWGVSAKVLWKTAKIFEDEDSYVVRFVFRVTTSSGPFRYLLLKNCVAEKFAPRATSCRGTGRRGVVLRRIICELHRATLICCISIIATIDTRRETMGGMMWQLNACPDPSAVIWECSLFSTIALCI